MKIIKIIIFLILSIFLTSCSNINEIDNIALIKQIGISKLDNNYEIIFNIEEIKNKVKVINTYPFTGDNLEDTYNKINYSIDKNLYMAHLDSIILSVNILENDYRNIINLLIKDKENRLDFSLYTIEDEELTKCMNYLKDNNSFNNLVINSNIRTSSVSNIKFDQFLNYYYEKLDFVIPEITKEDLYKLDNYIYLKDNLYFNKLDTNESIIYNYLNDKVYQTKIYDVLVLSNKSIIKYKGNSIDIKINSLINSKNKDDIKNYKKYLKEDIKLFISKYLKEIKNINLVINTEDDNNE